jgi:hypothetical protein
MPLFERNDPDVRSLIAYLVAKARDKGVTLNQTKLVKLLYLIDVERIASGRQALTGLRWVFFHYGPYALELPEILEPMEGGQLIVGEWNGARLYRAAPGAPEGDDWPSGTRSLVDNVVRRFAALDLNELLDHVYFHTAPMHRAVRGQPLDMDRAGTAPSPRRHAPLAPPRFAAGARERVDEALRRRRATFVPLSLDERRKLFADEPDEEMRLTKGRLVVPEDTEL